VRALRRPRTPDTARPQLDPIPAWSWTLIAIAVVVLTAAVITTWLLIIAGHAAAGTSRASAQLDAVRTGLAAGGGAGAAVGLMLAFRRQHHQEIATKNTDFDATERRITELYTKAVEQLGSDKAPVRLGGLYALERLAQDNPSQRQTIVNVICAYLRMPFTEAPTRPTARIPESISTEIENTGTSQIGDDAWQQEKEVRVTAQRILSVHLERPTSQDPTDASPSRFWPGMRVDLTGTVLFNFVLSKCVVATADFRRATFSGEAIFQETHFSGTAVFWEATFNELAWFRQATFSESALFDKATFSNEAWFGGAIFNGNVQFSEATFGSAVFSEATFNNSTGTWFNEAIFKGSVLFDRLKFRYGSKVISFRNAVAEPTSDERIWPEGWHLVEDNTGHTRITWGEERQD
jgi:Pentapeptide repeats (9 copies)